ncbi:MAG: response regulator [Deltaproteobacteria bacterium]|nr:MAG: response regulator [Deltaproteobacteria bacterium]
MKHRVLVVEDSGTMRDFIASVVEELEEVEVERAGSGFDALKVLPRMKFDLVITDINMPDINGLELIRFIRENPHYQATPLIIVSTESSRRDRERGLALGANAYLVKPFEPEELKRLVSKFLGLRADDSGK